MSLFDRVEKSLEGAVRGAFNKVFHSQVQAVEIASAIRRAMDERATTLAPGRTLVPNIYSVELATSDHQRLGALHDELIEELIAAAQEHAESERYQPGGPFEIHLGEDSSLETGVFRLRPSIAKHGTTAQGYASSGTSQPAPAPAPPAPSHHQPSQRAGSFDAASDRAQDEPPRPRYVSPAQRPWLAIDGERYPLIAALTVLGRDPAADIVLDDPGISRRHCELRVTPDGPHLVTSVRDLDSTNGTFVNGERVTSRRIENGDHLTVGRTSLIFRAGKR